MSEAKVSPELQGPIEVTEINVLMEILVYVGVDFIEHLRGNKVKEGTPEFDSYFEQVCFSIAALFVKDNPHVKLPDDWDMNALYERVKAHLADIEYPLENLGEVNDDEFLPIGVSQFLAGSMQIFDEIQEKNPSEDIKQQLERLVQDPQFLSWCFTNVMMFLGDAARMEGKTPDEIENESLN